LLNEQSDLSLFHLAEEKFRILTLSDPHYIHESVILYDKGMGPAFESPANIFNVSGSSNQRALIRSGCFTEFHSSLARVSLCGALEVHIP
jgi:hypothetical protein